MVRFDQGADRRLCLADDQIAFPVPGHRPVGDLGICWLTRTSSVTNFLPQPLRACRGTRDALPVLHALELSLRRFGLNRFGRFAWESWKVLAPTALAQIPDPRGHFSTLGATAESQWADLWPELLEPDVPGEDFFHKAGRIEAAKMRAEEMIRNELLIPPAEVQDSDGGDDPAMLTDVMVAWRDLMVEDTTPDQ